MASVVFSCLSFILIPSFVFLANLFQGFVQRRFHADQCYVIPYPFTISPTPYPRDEYHRARQLQSSINALVHRLAFDIDLMDTIFAR